MKLTSSLFHEQSQQEINAEIQWNQTWTKDALCSFGQPGYFGLKAPKATEEGQVMYPHHPLGYQNH